MTYVVWCYGKGVALSPKRAGELASRADRMRLRAVADVLYPCRRIPTSLTLSFFPYFRSALPPLARAMLAHKKERPQLRERPSLFLLCSALVFEEQT